MEQYRSGHNGHDWKSCDGRKPSVSSNLTCSAKKATTHSGGCFFAVVIVRFEGNVPVRGGKRPVNGFRVPRAGGGTAPVPPGESHLLRQQQKTSLAGVFCCYDEERVGFEGARV